MPTRRSFMNGVTASIGYKGLETLGQSWDHLVIFGGSGNNILFYEFTVSGDLRPSEDSGGAPIADKHVTFDDETPGRKGDRISGQTARGAIAGGGDAYQFTGEITSFTIDAGANVFINGRRVDPQTLGTASDPSRLPHHLVIFGGSGGNIIYYEFTVSGELAPSEESGNAPIADKHVTFDDETPGRKGDTISGNTAKGAIAGGGDAYRFSGDVTNFDIDGQANIYLDGTQVTPQTLDSGPSNPDKRTCALNEFRKYSYTEPSDFRETRRTLIQEVENLELYRQLSKLNINAIHAVQAIADLHYGDYRDATAHFLNLLQNHTSTLERENDHEYFGVIHDYSEYANSTYRLVNGSTESVTGYADLIQDAVRIHKEQNYETISAAIRVAARGVDGTYKDDAIGLAVEVGELPLADAVSGLKLNAREMLVAKVFIESQRPILYQLEQLARKRKQGRITEQEMYKYLIYQQEYWSASIRFSKQIINIEELARKKSILFNIARNINQILGNDPLKSAKDALQNSQFMFKNKTQNLANFHENVQKC